MYVIWYGGGDDEHISFILKLWWKIGRDWEMDVGDDVCILQI